VSAVHVLVMAKAPVAGLVKTRLCPPLSPDEAADVAAAALADTLAAVAECRADRKIIALDGQPGPWLPEGFDVIPQVGRGLGPRLANAWAGTAASTGGWGIQIGMDTPQVTASELDDLLALLDSPPTDRQERAAVLGPASDGGWWVIGLPGIDPRRVFSGVEMSTPYTGDAQLRRLRALGLDVSVVQEHRDVDAVADLAAVAEAHPHLRTAAAWRRWATSEVAMVS
jgi:glycosyltransferase A (GT-A) superfamily protein (DUF2064 family)